MRLFKTPSPIPLFQALIALSIKAVPNIISVLSPLEYSEAVLLALTIRKKTGYIHAITTIIMPIYPTVKLTFSLVL